jgi:hypothetical protein
VAQAKAHTNKLSATVVSVALDQLGEVVGSLAQKGQIIADALVAG